ncbi:MAG: hypothetical protein H7174_08985 [Flavobacterium sp.]|nr:hypothetical protein [Flavobacterium sp.]
MKKVILILAVFIFSQNQAQISVNLNLGTPPKWAPVAAPEAEYYYLPDVESYYDVRQSQFIYYGNGRWIRSRNLPVAYRSYDLFSGHKVVLNDYHGATPYVYFKNDKVKYYKFKGNKYRSQKVVYREEGNYDDNHENFKEQKQGKHDNGNHGRKNK